MARKRMVSPELLTSEIVAKMGLRGRYGFVALWMYLDDCGRGKDNASLIRAHTWPLDKTSTALVEQDLAEMATLGLVCRYSLDGQNYLHSPSWNEWQKVNHPTPSRIPPCEFHEPEAWELFTSEYGIPPGRLPEASHPVQFNSIQSNVVKGAWR